MSCQESGLCNSSYARYSENVLPKIIKLCMKTPCFVSFRGTNMAAGNQQNHVFFKFSYLCVNCSLQELIKIKAIFILRQGMFDSKISPNTRNVFDLHKSFPGRQLNASSRKSLEIQAFCIAKQRTLLNRKFVCIKVLRCSNITWK